MRVSSRSNEVSVGAPSNHEEETVSDLKTPKYQEENSSKGWLWGDSSFVVDGGYLAKRGANNELGGKNGRNMY